VFVSIHSLSKLYIEMGDASKNTNSNNLTFFFKRNEKRPRTQLEDTNGESHLNASENNDNNATPTASLTDLSDGFSDGLSATESTTSIPELRVNDINVNSNDTIITSAQLNKEKEHLAFKLDKLHDKAGRYESHVAFLKKCLDSNVTPNGLRVYVEPSIGNRDDEFLQSWHEHLNEFSRTLTRSVIEYSEKTVENTKKEIAEATEKLKSLVSTPAFTEIKNALTRNDNTRNNELTSRKNRKFYRLKYGERERDRELERNGAPSRGTVILSNRGQRGMNRPSNSNLETGNTRENRSYHNEEHRNRNSMDRRETRSDRQNGNKDDDITRVLSVINNRNQNYAEETRNQVSNTNHNRGDATLPIHERISLNRRKSRNNLRQERSPREDQYNNPREGNSPREDPPRHSNDHPREGAYHQNGDRNPMMGNRPREGQSHHRDGRETHPQENINRHTNDRDTLIEALQQKIENLERNRSEPQQRTSNCSNETNQHPKNGPGAQQHQGPRAKNLEEMQAYLAEAMATISEFAKQLSGPTGSKQTHSDK
jgi:hypothetical protein